MSVTLKVSSYDFQEDRFLVSVMKGPTCIDAAVMTHAEISKLASDVVELRAVASAVKHVRSIDWKAAAGPVQANAAAAAAAVEGVRAILLGGPA